MGFDPNPLILCGLIHDINDACSPLQVRRALIIMHQRDELEYKRERRVILRKA